MTQRQILAFILLVVVVVLPGCRKQNIPPVRQEGSTCTTVGAMAIDSAGNDLQCMEVAEEIKRWVRIR